jgi:hypothetical protein
MAEITGSLSSLASSLRDSRTERQKYSNKLAAGGEQALWSDKTSAQIDTSITTTNRIERLEGFGKNNKLVEGRLRAQLLALDDFMRLARDIHTEFMPGRYTLGGAKPGLAATLQSFKDRFTSIGNRVDPISGEYAMGGIATQNAPISSTFTSYTGSATDYSNPVSGSITVYINDMGDTVTMTGNDFDAEVSSLYHAIYILSTSTTGSDASSDQASSLASDAHKAFLSRYYQKLDQLNSVIEQDEELSELISQATTLREEVTGESMEDLLAKVTTLSIMEDIRQHLFTQQSRKAQEAAAMIKQG